MDPQLKYLLRGVEMARSRFLHGLDCVPDDRLAWSPGGAAGTPLQLASRYGLFLSSVAHMLQHRTMRSRPAAPPAAAETREEAKAAVDAGFGNLKAVIGALTAADLEQTAPAPWNPETPLAEWLYAVPGVLGYFQGQLNYLQLAYGDKEANIPPNWGREEA